MRFFLKGKTFVIWTSLDFIWAKVLALTGFEKKTFNWAIGDVNQLFAKTSSGPSANERMFHRKFMSILLRIPINNNTNDLRIRSSGKNECYLNHCYLPQLYVNSRQFEDGNRGQLIY